MCKNQNSYIQQWRIGTVQIAGGGGGGGGEAEINYSSVGVVIDMSCKRYFETVSVDRISKLVT